MNVFGFGFMSFRRKPESILPGLTLEWIPAFAGMTESGKTSFNEDNGS